MRQSPYKIIGPLKTHCCQPCRDQLEPSQSNCWPYGCESVYSKGFQAAAPAYELIRLWIGRARADHILKVDRKCSRKAMLKDHLTSGQQQNLALRWWPEWVMKPAICYNGMDRRRLTTIKIASGSNIQEGEINEWICLIDTSFLYTAASRHSAGYWKWAEVKGGMGWWIGVGRCFGHHANMDLHTQYSLIMLLLAIKEWHFGMWSVCPHNT